MTAPIMSLRRHYPNLQAALRAMVSKLGSDADDDVSTAWIIDKRGQTRWRGPGRVVSTTRLIIRRQGIPASTVSIDDDGKGCCLSLADVLVDIDAAFAAGSAALAARFGVTPRCAQQIMAAATELQVQGVLLFLAGGKEGSV